MKRKQKTKGDEVALSGNGSTFFYFLVEYGLLVKQCVLKKNKGGKKKEVLSVERVIVNITA